MRLIDADVLKKELAIGGSFMSGSCNNCAYGSIFGCCEDIRVAYVCDSIHEAPTVDAVPVSFLEKLRDNAQNEEAALMIDEIIAQWRLKHDH